MSQFASHFSKLADLSKATSSEARRQLLRKVTDEIFEGREVQPGTDLGNLDQVLASVASDYSKEVRAELAMLVATNPGFRLTAEQFAQDDIEIAGPVLIRSRVVSDATLLKVINKKSQPHMMAVTQRQQISPAVSYALIESGNDEVVVALLTNTGAEIENDAFVAVTERAQSSEVLQAPLVRRRDVPIELLNEIYTKVESGLRQEIVRKFGAVSPEEVDKAFQRSRRRLSKRNANQPEDYEAAIRKVEDLARRGNLLPPVLVTLLREGKTSRTTFIVAFARLTDVEYEMIYRAVTAKDLDTIALLCRGSGFDRALYVTLMIALKNPDDRAGPSAEELGKLYESVPVLAAQRAIRFWKVRVAA